MVIPEQQAMQKSKPIPYPVGSVLMQKLAQAQQAALAAQQPSPREGGIAQVAAKGGVLKYIGGGYTGSMEDVKKVKAKARAEYHAQPTRQEQIAKATEVKPTKLGDLPGTENLRSEVSKGVVQRQKEAEATRVKQEKATKAANAKAAKATTKRSAGWESEVEKMGPNKQPKAAKPKAQRPVKGPTAEQRFMSELGESPLDTAVKERGVREAADKTAVQRAGATEARMKARGLTEQGKTPAGKVSQGQRSIGRAAGPDYRKMGIEQAAKETAVPDKRKAQGIYSAAKDYIEQNKAEAKQLEAEKAEKSKAEQQAAEAERSSAAERKAKALEQRKADRYKASEAAEKDGAEPKKVSKEAESYRKERLGSEARVAEAQQKGASFEEAGLGKSRTSMPGAKAAKAASPASFMDNLTGSVKNFFSKNPDMMANARQVAQDVLAKNPEATMDEIGAAIKKAATPEAIRAMEAEIAPTLEKHGMRDFFSRAAGGISGMAKAAPGALGTAAVMYPVAAGIKDVLDENFDAQNKFNRGLRDVGNAIIPAAQADEPADADIQRLEKMGRGEMSIADIAGAPPAQAPAPRAAPPAPAPQAPQGVAQAAPAAPAAPQGGIAAAPQAPAPKQDIYAGDTSEGTPQSAISELMGLQGPGYQYSPEVMGMLKDAKDEERGNTLLKMIGMTGAGLANRNRYEGAHDAALLATQAFTSGTEREDEAQKQFLQGIIHNEQVPFEQRAKAYNDYVSMQKSKATNEALMARAGLSADARRYAADQSLAGKAYGGGSGQNQQYKAMHNKAVMYKQLAHEVAMSDPDKAQEYLALAEQYETQAGGLAGLAGDEGLGQTTTPRLTLDAFK
jgi:hypothetical protein